jgi:hypothetical protein
MPNDQAKASYGIRTFGSDGQWKLSIAILFFCPLFFHRPVASHRQTVILRRFFDNLSLFGM